MTRAERYGPKNYTINVLISVDIDNYQDKFQIFISFKFKYRYLLQSESCRNLGPYSQNILRFKVAPNLLI